MITRDDIDTVRGGTAYSDDGSKLGKVGEVYLDNDSGEPAWVTVSTGLFGTRQSFVPLDGASLDGDDLRLPHSKATVKDAPNIGDDESLTPEAEDELYRHYGVDGSHGSQDGARDQDRDRDGVRDQDRDRDSLRDQDRDGVRDRDRDEHGDDGSVGRTAAAAGVAGVGGAAGGAALRGRGDDRDRDDRDRDGRRDDRDHESAVDRVRDHGDDHDRDRDRDRDRESVVDRARDLGDRDGDRDRDRDRDGERRGSAGPRLRKHTVTEMQTITVPVEKEVYTLEDEDGPVDDAQRDASGRETGSRHGRTDDQR